MIILILWRQRRTTDVALMDRESPAKWIPVEVESISELSWFAGKHTAAVVMVVVAMSVWVAFLELEPHLSVDYRKSRIIKINTVKTGSSGPVLAHKSLSNKLLCSTD